MQKEVPDAIIEPAFLLNKYVRLNIPQKLANECHVTSGARFAVFSRDHRIFIEQIGEETRAQLGTTEE